MVEFDINMFRGSSSDLYTIALEGQAIVDNLNTMNDISKDIYRMESILEARKGFKDSIDIAFENNNDINLELSFSNDIMKDMNKSFGIEIETISIEGYEDIVLPTNFEVSNEGISSSLKKIYALVKKAFDKVWEAIKKLWGKIKKTIDKLMGKYAKSIRDIFKDSESIYEQEKILVNKLNESKVGIESMDVIGLEDLSGSFEEFLNRAKEKGIGYYIKSIETVVNDKLKAKDMIPLFVMEEHGIGRHNINRLKDHLLDTKTNILANVAVSYNLISYLMDIIQFTDRDDFIGGATAYYPVKLGNWIKTVDEKCVGPKIDKEKVVSMVVDVSSVLVYSVNIDKLELDSIRHIIPNKYLDKDFEITTLTMEELDQLGLMDLIENLDKNYIKEINIEIDRAEKHINEFNEYFIKSNKIVSGVWDNQDSNIRNFFGTEANFINWVRVICSSVFTVFNKSTYAVPKYIEAVEEIVNALTVYDIRKG